MFEPSDSCLSEQKQYYRSAATEIIATSFEKLIVFGIYNESGSSGSAPPEPRPRLNRIAT